MVDPAKAPDAWESPQNILVILAHPDDPEFFCGATTARWLQAGHHVSYCVITCGDKGTKDLSLGTEELCAIRQREQRAAAKVLGVKEVRFLNYPDCMWRRLSEVWRAASAALLTVASITP